MRSLLGVIVVAITACGGPVGYSPLKGETNLAAIDVPAGGSAVLEASMVLGGPSGGALRQSLRVD